MLWMASWRSPFLMNMDGPHIPRTTPPTATAMCRTSSKENRIPAHRWISRTLSIPLIFRMNHWAESTYQNRWHSPVAKRTTVERMIPQCSRIRYPLNLFNLFFPVSIGAPVPRSEPLSPVDRVSPDVQEDLQNESQRHERDEDPIGRVDEEDNRILGKGRLVVRQPGVGEILVGVLVALLAPLDEVGLDHDGVRARGAGDIVGAMAVRADGDRPGRLVELLPLLPVQPEGDPVEVGKVGVQDSRGQPVLADDRRVRVAVPAHLGDLLVVLERQRIVDVVRRVAVDAHRDVLVLLVEEGVAVDALGVHLVDAGMALPALLGGDRPSLHPP